ncbi:hypothetical protein LOAG_12260 [Loa loa]|uniref:Uncharacterized protein n=1 Tax=Loa loa TaxID=7209 RepID=A0A1S0TN22_LOALO|nr:hypothetical protein LOAG_12260 [Loa loa]EFO16248.1 hypothetical protein LOAG_12260 [Loa loa]
MVIRNSGAAIFISSLDNDKRLYLVILGTLCIAITIINVAILFVTLTVTLLFGLFVLSFLAVGIVFGVILAAVNVETPAVFKHILRNIITRISFVFRNLKTDGSYASSDVGSDLKVVYVESQPSGVVDELIVP